MKNSAAPTAVVIVAAEGLQAQRKTAKQFISVELNMGQMIEDVKLASECRRPVTLCSRVGGMIPTPEQVLDSIKKANGGER